MNLLADEQSINFLPTSIIVAGWTGRDQAAVEHHIDELKALGISPPSRVPLFYRVSSSLLTTEGEIQVVGGGSSGEVEPLLLKCRDELWISVASDHTDRDLEVFSVAASKQACAKPCARQLWRFADVSDHLDELVLSCQIKEDEQWVMYQQGTLAHIRPLAELISRYPLVDDSAMLCGTLGAIGGVRPACDYRMSLHDPVTRRSIEMAYHVRVLPLVQ